MLLKQKQLCQSKENKWNTKASYYKAFQSLIKTIVCGISKNIFGVVDLKETGGSIEEEEEGRVVRTGSELQNHVIEVQRETFPLVRNCKDVISTSSMPKLRGWGWGSNLNWGLKATAGFFAILAAPELVSKLSVGKHLKLLDFQLGKVFFINADVEPKTCSLLLSINVFTTELEAQCEPRRIPG